MDRNVLKSICTTLVGSKELPGRVIDHAESLVLQSGTKLPLKPMEEPARRHICCLLAVEQAAAKLEIPDPKFEKTPLPPNAFNKLVDEFRSVLIRKRGRDSELVNDDDGRSPRSSPTKRTSRASTPRASTPRSSTPRGSTQARASPAGMQKFSGKIDAAQRRAQNAMPTAAQIKKVGTKLELKEATMKAINHAFELYQGLVKDNWGFMIGLFYVIMERAEPQPDLRSKVITAVTSSGIPGAARRLEEWESWARRVATGHRWVADISVVPEAMPQLYGSAGGWGTKTPQLIPLDSSSSDEPTHDGHAGHKVAA